MIMKYLQETSGKRVTLGDVHNLVQRLKSKIFRAFPEVVMLDSTHGTNASKYKLFGFMIDDVFGHISKTSVGDYHGCMKDVIDAFKENNPSWDRIRATMIEKDFGESSLLKKGFHLARVLICHFHLKKYLRTEMSKAIYGGRDAVDVDRFKDAVDIMVKSQDAMGYDKGVRYMYYLLDPYDDQDQLPKAKYPLLVYFIKNWESCKEIWAVYERGHVVHLGNHTNNRCSNQLGGPKTNPSPEMRLNECVKMLIFLQSTAELEYASHFHVIGSRHCQGADDILLRLAALVSSRAFNLVRQEQELFKGGSLAYGGRWLQDDMVQLRSSSIHQENVVNTNVSLQYFANRLSSVE
ncbi:hypothetical protein PHMEG_0004379 [Phytophthora megakarya]|uniref:ZSWIM1/3 RNaseH-like domain-containing protein n=1 Tax=Phytophthora megakarya TaxID=4795 RepID=A0A225WVL6_9STRA|nr:hypothetical protein PHMEG_0004379 [Phytophthora megakarya]